MTEPPDYDRMVSTVSKGRNEKRFFHGLQHPIVNADGSVRFEYVRNETNKASEIKAKKWASRVVSLMLSERVNPIEINERRHV